MMGAALGGVVGHVLPGASPGAWALVGLAGALGGVTRSPFTAIIFAFELTYDDHVLLALLVAATLAHLVSVLVLKRSILTEKVARRGFHVMREYSVDPLEATFVREVMDTDVFTVEPEVRLMDVYGAMPEGSTERRQRLYPVLDDVNQLVGVLPWSVVMGAKDDPSQKVRESMIEVLVTAYPDEILRTIADRMAAHGVSVIPVVGREDATHLEGLITQFDLLKAREKLLVEERHSERLLTLNWISPPRRSRGVSDVDAHGGVEGGTDIE
jgi:CBS domain-containing protein